MRAPFLTYALPLPGPDPHRSFDGYHELQGMIKGAGAAKARYLDKGEYGGFATPAPTPPISLDDYLPQRGSTAPAPAAINGTPTPTRPPAFASVHMPASRLGAFLPCYSPAPPLVQAPATSPRSG